ncbi:MAG: LLM class flavin-dependent oxidoreductase [Candidatus Rokubacteria bacterium]|nr:LLM class flavin-dependent oxidoreductase [Candidatus Rokubacteria bacterium]
MPKPVQCPHPELMLGGGGEKVTLRIAACWADHWNVWGGPVTLAQTGKILERHCAAVGRDPATIPRSANMALVMSEDPAKIEKAQRLYMARLGAHEAKARDTVLGGSAGQILDTLGRLAAAGVGMLFIPTMFLPCYRRPVLDRFIDEVAPPFRAVPGARP